MEKKLLKKLKAKIFPSHIDRMARLWESDGGDEAFRFDYELDDNSVVIDLGGYDGQWASDIYSRYGCTVYIFEPVLEYSEKIAKRFAKNPKIKVFSYALGGTSRTLEIAVSGTSSSVFTEVGGKPLHKIQVVDASKWLEDAKLDSIDLMKVNIEGGEYELVDRLIAADKIRLIKDIQIQFHDVRPDSKAHMNRIQQQLARTHKKTYAYEFIWENRHKQ